MQAETKVIKGGVTHLVGKPVLRTDLVGGDFAMKRFWTFMRFVFDIGIEHATVAFLTADIWPSVDDAAARILSQMAESIPRFQEFYSKFACGDLFDYMV